MEGFASFYRLYLFRLISEGEDKLWWNPSKRGLFNVKSFYSVMDCQWFMVPLEKCLED